MLNGSVAAILKVALMFVEPLWKNAMETTVSSVVRVDGLFTNQDVM